MGRLIDLTGQKFGRLMVKRLGKHGSNIKTTWFCTCDCGADDVEVRADQLKSGETKSCGCYNNENCRELGKQRKKYNTYDMTGKYGMGYTTNGEKFYFDIEDYDKIKDCYWSVGNTGYMRTADNNGNWMLMHRLIAGILDDPKFQVDHINHNTTDNRKVNLRVCSNSENARNRDVSKYNKTGVTGVYWHQARKKYAAAITVNYKKISLGYFEDINDAIEARKEAEEKYFGEYSYDNSMAIAGEVGKESSLQFPVFCGLREINKEVSYD